MMALPSPFLPALVCLAPVRLSVLLLVPGYQRQLAPVVQAEDGETDFLSGNKAKGGKHS